MSEEEISPELAARNMWKWQWRRRVALAQGLYQPQLLLKGGRVLNVFTEELVEADVAIDAGRIAGIGSFPDGRETIDISGCIVAPSFIDAHIHTESSLLWLPEFAKAVVPHGTGAIITDPHEVANVRGLAGIAAMREAATSLPIQIHFTAPSSVPASPFEHPGATFDDTEIETMLAWPETVGLGEFMNVPGLVAGESSIGNTLWASKGSLRDGHAPGLRGGPLQSYIGSGIGADHESVTMEEAREKLELGMFLYLREGSSEKNLVELLPLVTDKTYPRIAFASDDRDCHDLLTKGHVDDILRIAIAHGLDPIRAIRMATWNPANHWRLADTGAVAPGYRADLVVLRDLATVDVAMTLYQGHVVAQDGAFAGELPDSTVPDILLHTINVAPVHLSDLRLDPAEATKAVGVIPGQIVTEFREVEPTVLDGAAIADPARDLLKLVSVERHHATGRTGVGYVQGLGLTRGAIASSIAHDAHNIVAAGANDIDILAAIATIAEMDGGLAVVADGEVLAAMPLPIAGLMSASPAAEVAAAYAEMEHAAQALGSPLASPFGQLAFLSLSVIPEARVTDGGFLDLRDSTSPHG
ncbi:MAG: adenine deaminase [Thermomicrobiales bacterium]